MQPNRTETDIDKVPLTDLAFWGGQWRTIYTQRRRLHDVNTEQIILGQFFTLTVTMAAGLLLEQNKEALLLIGTTLVLYPALADMLSSSAAVMTASIHHEIDNIDGSKFWKVASAVASTMFVSILTSVVLGVLSGVIGVFFFGSSFLHTLLLATLAGSLSGIVGLPVMLGITLIIRSRKSNPDDVTAPIETTIFSSLTLLAIAFVSRWIP